MSADTKGTAMQACESIEATSKQRETLAKLVAAWEGKNAKTAARMGGFGLMAVSLAACGGGDDVFVEEGDSVVVNPPVDTDGDGVVDSADAYPNDANETNDTDGDGVGDNADYYPTNPDMWAMPQSFTLDTDQLVGSAGNDVFTADDVSQVNPTTGVVTTYNTFGSLDSLDGGLGDDTLNIVSVSAINTTTAVAHSVTGIETVNITVTAPLSNSFSGDAITANTVLWSGLETLNTTNTVGGNQTITAASSTDVTSSSVGMVTVNGGEDIVITTAAAASVGTTIRNSGDVSVTVTGGITVGVDTAGFGAAGDVTATTSGGGVVAIMGGADVTVTSSGALNATSGAIGVGGANALPTGAVDISASAVLLDAGNSTTARTGAITVVGGSTVNVELTGIVAGGSDVGGDALTFGAVGVTGSASTTSVTVTQSAAVARVANTGANFDGTAAIVNGAVTITDATAANGVADTISSVTISNSATITINSSALTSLTLSGVTGATTINGQSTVEAATLGLNLNGGASNGVTATEASTGYTTVNVAATGANTVAGLSAAEATAVNISGTGSVSLGTVTTAAAGVITSTNTGGVTLTMAGATQQFVGTGSSGNDTITLAANTSVAHSTGAGNDTVILGANTLAQGGSIDAGEGTADVLSLAAANAATLTLDDTFEGLISGFEQLSIGASGANPAINLANLDDINYVTSAGSTAGTLDISGFQSGGTFAQTALLAGATTLTGALTGGADSFTLRASGANGYTNSDALSLAHVETLTIVLDDNAGEVATTAFDLKLNAANASTVTVSGDAGITFLNSTLTSVATMDASGVTATGAGGAVTFNGNNIASTITGGAGGDTLTGGTQDDVISGGDGVDSLTGGTGNDMLTGGTGNDMLTGGTGNDMLTGDTGVDTMSGGTGQDEFVLDFTDVDTTLEAVTDIIEDFVASDDSISVGTAGTTSNYTEATAAVADLATLLSAANDALNGTIKFYVGQVGSNSYLVMDDDGTGYSSVVELVGVDLSNISYADIIA